MNGRWRDSEKRKLRNWRIAAGLLGLVALYGLMGRMDHAAQADRMHLEQPLKSKQLSSVVRA